MAEQQSVFRKVSLDRLSSPEQLDQKLTVVSPAGWVAVLSAAILILAALAWGIFGSISNKVNGSGVLMFGDGIVAITAQTGGQITDISARAGDFVESGQIIARVSQDDLIRQMERIRKNLAALEAITADTLDIDAAFMNSEIYPEFAQLAGQIRLARAQLWAQELEALRNEQLMEDELEMQALNVEILEAQIRVLQGQIGEYQRLLSYQREVNIANAAAQDRERAASLNQPDQALLSMQGQINNINTITFFFFNKQ